MSCNINKDKQNVTPIYAVPVCSSLPLSHSHFLREILLNAEEMTNLTLWIISLGNFLGKRWLKIFNLVNSGVLTKIWEKGCLKISNNKKGPPP